jgi:hypothetical protein
MATHSKKPSIERAEQSVIMDRVLQQKKKELSPEDFRNYVNFTIEQELLEEAARRNLLTIPDPKLHQHISFVKSTIRLAACAFGFFSMYELAFIGLFLAEIVGIGEELV